MKLTLFSLIFSTALLAAPTRPGLFEGRVFNGAFSSKLFTLDGGTITDCKTREDKLLVCIAKGASFQFEDTIKSSNPMNGFRFKKDPKVVVNVWKGGKRTTYSWYSDLDYELAGKKLTRRFHLTLSTEKGKDVAEGSMGIGTSMLSRSEVTAVRLK